MKKINRGLTNEEIQAIIKKKKSVSNSHFIVYFDDKSRDVGRVSISVGKKLGNAVIRNKTRRQVREIIKNLINLDFDYVLIIRAPFLNSSYNKRVDEFNHINNKILRRLNYVSNEQQ